MSRVIEQHVPSGHAVLFTSGLNHAGGKSVTDEYSYRLFAYIVSDKVDHPSEVATRIKIPNYVSIGSANEDTNGEGEHTMRGRQTKEPDRLLFFIIGKCINSFFSHNKLKSFKATCGQLW
jgi:hypothetical protein